MLFDGEEIKLLTAKDLNLLMGGFLMGEMNKSLAVRYDFSPIPRVTRKSSVEGGTVHTWSVQQFCDMFGKKGDGWHMILGDSPAGHGFVLRDLVLIELLQISHNCVTERMRQAKNYFKTYLKAIKDTFFPNM